jgi:hypothetical protein
MHMHDRREKGEILGASYSEREGKRRSRIRWARKGKGRIDRRRAARPPVVNITGAFKRRRAKKEKIKKLKIEGTKDKNLPYQLGVGNWINSDERMTNRADQITRKERIQEAGRKLYFYCLRRGGRKEMQLREMEEISGVSRVCTRRKFLFFVFVPQQESRHFFIKKDQQHQGDEQVVLYYLLTFTSMC